MTHKQCVEWTLNSVIYTICRLRLKGNQVYPARGADGAFSAPLVDWDRVRYTIPLFIPLDAFGVLVKGDPKTENYGGSLMGFGVQKSP